MITQFSRPQPPLRHDIRRLSVGLRITASTDFAAYNSFFFSSILYDLRLFVVYIHTRDLRLFHQLLWLCWQIWCRGKPESADARRRMMRGILGAPLTPTYIYPSESKLLLPPALFHCIAAILIGKCRFCSCGEYDHHVVLISMCGDKGRDD